MKLIMMIMLIILFSQSKTLYAPVIILSARDNQKLSKRLSKGFRRSVYWNEYKIKTEDENTINEFR